VQVTNEMMKAMNREEEGMLKETIESEKNWRVKLENIGSMMEVSCHQFLGQNVTVGGQSEIE
ncbi:hypothetical protein A2U01_0024265, partial [Trifolium medium]|nr:hypothetical protein [Trifolium medium]